MVVNTQTKLESLGLTSYEARSYMALYQEHPATAYEIAKTAGIPTSKIYETLGKLKTKGLVLEGKGEDKILYTPLEIESFIANCRNELEENLSGLQKDFKQLEKGSKGDILWNLSSQEECILRAQSMIQSTKQQVLLSSWQEELDKLEEPVRTKKKQGIKTAILLFGQNSYKDLEPLYCHPIQDTLQKERGGRVLVLVSDSKEALWCTFSEKGLQGGAYSQSPGFVTMAEDYIKHDIYMMKIVQRFDDELIKRFGQNYKLLRDIFSNQELT